jgi:hypothetical protein
MSQRKYNKTKIEYTKRTKRITFLCTHHQSLCATHQSVPVALKLSVPLEQISIPERINGEAPINSYPIPTSGYNVVRP